MKRGVFSGWRPPGGPVFPRRALVFAAVAGLSVALLSGCASGMRVQRIATEDPNAPAYALQAAEVAPLRVQAQRLCPEGYTVVQRWERHDLAPNPESMISRIKYKAFSMFSDAPGAQARLIIQCKPFVEPQPPLPQDTPASDVPQAASQDEVG